MAKKPRPFENLAFSIETPQGFPPYSQDLLDQMIEAYIVAAENIIAMGGNVVLKIPKRDVAFTREYMKAGMKSIYTLLAIHAGAKVTIIENAK